jgi:hypothetical protein
MKQLYRVLAYAVAGGVVAQAMVIVYAIGSMQRWVNRGGSYTAGMDDDASAFPGAGAFRVHEFIGDAVVPGLVVLLVIVSLFAKVTRGIIAPVVMFGLVAAQALLGYEASDQPAIGSLHGLFAFVLFTVALRTGLLVTRSARETAPAEHDQRASAGSHASRNAR